jgi:hypothetical protein
MAPDSDNPVRASSNSGRVTYLRDETLPNWVSKPEEDDFENPTVTVTTSEEDAFIREISIDGKGNIDYVNVVVVDSNGDEVRCLYAKV